MGRYYHGDIEGKFWFAIQESNDADYFGSQGYTPDELHYYFNSNQIPEIQEGIDNCITVLGKDKEKLDNFFKDRTGYSDKDLSDLFAEDTSSINEKLKWYARLELGQKILDCVEEQGSCSFLAEL